MNMDRLTRPTVAVDPKTAQYLGDAVDIRTMSDKMLDMVLNGPTLNGARKGALRQMIRQLYATLSQFEAEANEPLTLEQLQEMDGEPVWDKPWGVWGLVDVNLARVFTPKGDLELFSDDVMGCLYRHKPKEAPERMDELPWAEEGNSSPGMGWISVKEPPDLGGGVYLVWTRNTGVEKCRWSEKRKRWIGGRWTEQITHWMPMPVPPKEVKGT